MKEKKEELTITAQLKINYTYLVPGAAKPLPLNRREVSCPETTATGDTDISSGIAKPFQVL